MIVIGNPFVKPRYSEIRQGVVAEVCSGRIPRGLRHAGWRVIRVWLLESRSQTRVFHLSEMEVPTVDFTFAFFSI